MKSQPYFNPGPLRHDSRLYSLLILLAVLDLFKPRSGKPHLSHTMTHPPDRASPLVVPSLVSSNLSGGPRRKSRKIRTQFSQTPRSWSALDSHNPICQGWSCLPSRTSLILDFAASIDALTHPPFLSALPLETVRCSLDRFSPCDDGSTAVPFLSSALAPLRAISEYGFGIPFSAVVSRGHDRPAKAPAPWRHGALLLRGAPAFESLPKRLAGPAQLNTNLFWFLPKMQSLTWGAGATCF